MTHQEVDFVRTAAAAEFTGLAAMLRLPINTVGAGATR